VSAASSAPIGASLLNQLAEMPAFLARTLGGLPPPLLLRQPANDAFPLIEHLWHLRDCDPDLYALRIRQVLREERPRLEPVDVGAWYGERRYRDRAGAQAIAEFAALRAGLVAELAALDGPALARTGVRADGREIDVLGLVEHIAEHDRDHRWRIAAILGSFAANAAA
jgi:hypothetical protein